jgi:hypothetical protein
MGRTGALKVTGVLFSKVRVTVTLEPAVRGLGTFRIMTW